MTHALREIDLSERGPYRVGWLEWSVASAEDPDRRLPTSVWYPAEDAGEARPEPPHPFGQPHRAEPGLPPGPGSRPLIVFSHGNSGMRHQSTFLTTHLASWGYVVAAPDHVGNTLPETAQRTEPEAIRAAHLEARRDRPLDALGVLRALLDEGTRPELPELDPDRVGALGHSFGGWTALKLAGLDPRVRAVCGLAPADEAFVGRAAFRPGELPLRPGTDALVVAGADDVLVDLEQSIRPLHARLGPDAALEILERADHFHFCDGIDLLHTLHERNPRPRQSRPTRPLAELLGETETHAWLGDRVVRFFERALGPASRAMAGGVDDSGEETR